MNYLFLILGIDSFHEAMIMSKLLSEMPTDTGIFCMSGEIPATYFAENQRICKIFLKGTAEENKKLLDEIVEEGQISCIFIFDFHKTFFTSYYKHDYQIIPFNLRWLENISVPVNLIDSLDCLDYNEENKIYLKYSIGYNVEDFDKVNKEYNLEDSFVETEQLLKPKADLSPYGFTSDMVSKFDFYPNIIKLCPPCQVAPKSYAEDKIIYWNYSDKDVVTDDMEKMKTPLGITDDKKNVLLIFSSQMQLQSLIRNSHSHYMRVIKTIIIYLKRLNIPVNFFIINMANPPNGAELTKGTKITMRTFKSPNHNLYRTIMNFADVLITDSTWHPSLLDAVALNLPAAVIGNSVSLQDDKTYEAKFESTDPEVFKLLSQGVQEAPQTIFPFSCYPLKDPKPQEFRYYDDVYPYYLVDIYSDESTLSFLGEFLDSGEIIEDLRAYQEIYLKRTTQSMSTNELLFYFEKS